MKDELWMRTWNDGQPRFSDDLHRGILWLLAPFRRLGKHTAPQVTLGGEAHSKAG